MKWDIDKEMRRFEPVRLPGTTWQRVLMDVSLARKEGIKIPEGKEGDESINVWSLGIGCAGEPKHFVHGLTMHECYLRLRRQVQLKKVDFNPQLFPMLGKKRTKPKERRKKRRKEAS